MSATLDTLRELFAARGSSQYGGEAVTQLEHTLQAAALAVADDALVAASLLHGAFVRRLRAPARAGCRASRRAPRMRWPMRKRPGPPHTGLAAARSYPRRRMLAWSLVVTVALVPARAPGQTMAGETSAPPGGEAASVRVMSFNIRYGAAADGPNHWDRRRDLLADTIRAFDPDLLGNQETLADQKAFLDAALPRHRSVGVGRDDGKLRGEMTAIWYRHDRFEPLGHGHFWLSETPHVPGSVSWDSALTRMATWIRLRDRRRPEAKPVVFLNTHFDHRGAQARRQAAILVRREAARLGEGCDVILAGDFNAAEGSPPYDALFSDAAEGGAAGFRDAYRVAHPQPDAAEGTFNGFRAEVTVGPRIDWIGVSPGWRVLAAEIDRTARDGRTPSDYFSVTAALGR